MAAVQTPLGSTASNHSLAPLAAAGATHVRLYLIWYMAGMKSGTIALNTNAASPLRSEIDAELRSTFAAAAQLGLQTILSPCLDFDWDQTDMTLLAPYNTNVGALVTSFYAARRGTRAGGRAPMAATTTP